MNIKIIDDVFSLEERNVIWNTCITSDYKYGEADTTGGHPTGVVCDMDTSSITSAIILNKIKGLVEYSNVYRMFINCFAPYENPIFHRDCEEDDSKLSIIYYPRHSYDIEDGGETQFLNSDDTVFGVMPKPNRIVIFDSNLIHKATSHKSKHKFTIVIKVG
jgi:hypothetical protein